jgi:hypothetical protein
VLLPVGEELSVAEGNGLSVDEGLGSRNEVAGGVDTTGDSTTPA